MPSHPPSPAAPEADPEWLRHYIAQLESELEAARASVYEQQASAARLRVLAEASREFAAATTDLEALFRTITRFVANAVGGLCSLRLIAPDGILFQRGYTAHPNPAAERLAAVIEDAPLRSDEGYSSVIVESRRSLLIPVVPPDALRARVPPQFLPFLDQFGISSALMVPMILRDRVIGTLTLSRDSGAYPCTLDDPAHDRGHRRPRCARDRLRARLRRRAAGAGDRRGGHRA